MKGIFNGIVKNVIISVLAIICLILVLSLIFYNKIALSKAIPEVEEYYLTEEMQEEIEESNLEETEEVIINYHIDAADLKKYEKNNEYTEGKNHPFAEISEYTENKEETSSGNKGQTGFYEDDGTK